MSPTKTIRSLFLLASPKCSRYRETPVETARTAPKHHNFEKNIEMAEEIIAKWDPEASAYAKITSIFSHSREEAHQFLLAVADLQSSMHSIMADSAVSGANFIVRGHNLIKAAMRCLQKEIYRILSSNRDSLDPESIHSSLNSSSSISDLEEEEIHISKESIDEVESLSLLAMADLKAIAECMISCGYGKECVNIYKTIRRSIVDEGLYKLGFDKLSPAQIQKLDWDILGLRIRNWLASSKVAVRTLFAGERALCDHVFSSSSSIQESSFAEIARDHAIYFLGFPELVALKHKLTPEKVFRILDMYNSISELLPEIESIFSYNSTATVCTQASSSRARLAEVVRALLFNFEETIQKDSFKTTVPGGDIHPLTQYTMNYLILLANYAEALSDIYKDQAFQLPASIPRFLFETSAPPSPVYRGGESFISSVPPRFAWLVLNLLCKLDSKAEGYRDVRLAYLFLANNLRYVVNKVRESKLNDILGDEWVFKNEAKVRNYAASYERLAWGKVLAVAAPSPAMPTREALRQFNEAFSEACKEHVSWIVPDEKMRDEIKLSVLSKLLSVYKNLHQAADSEVSGEKGLPSLLQFKPDDISDHFSFLFLGSSSPVSSPRVIDTY